MEIAGYRVNSVGELFEAGEAGKLGAFYWGALSDDHKSGRLMFCCLCGCGQIAGIVVGEPQAVPPVWGWNENPDKPTATPSIQIHPCSDNCKGWHGYLTDGVFKDC